MHTFDYFTYIPLKMTHTVQHVYTLHSSNVNNAFRTIHKCTKHFKDIPGCLDVAQEIKKQIEEFKPFIPLIQGLRNQGMRNRHWEQVCVVCVRACMLALCAYSCLCLRAFVCAYVRLNVHCLLQTFPCYSYQRR